MKTSSQNQTELGSRSAQSSSTYNRLAKLAASTAHIVARTRSSHTLSGINPTHLADATQDAIHDFAAQFPTTCLSPRNFTGARLLVTRRLLRRAVARSLRASARHGMPGDNGLGNPAFDPVTVLDFSPAGSTEPIPNHITPADRKAALQTLWQLCRVPADEIENRRRAAKRRFRVCARIIAGLPLADCIAGEYSSLKRWYGSMTASGLIQKLEAVWPGIIASLHGYKSHGYYQPKHA